MMKHWHNDHRLHTFGRDNDILSHRKSSCSNESRKLGQATHSTAIPLETISLETDSSTRCLIPGHGKRQEIHRHYEMPMMAKRQRRSTLTVLAKSISFCSAMIMICMLMYIPIYNKASSQKTKELGIIGWPQHRSRDTKVYVQPNNVTSIREPKHVCVQNSKNKLFLLIVVCSSTTNFDSRLAIRETWGNYRRYIEMSKLYHAVKEKYANYNYSYDLYSEKLKMNISIYNQFKPEVAKAFEDDYLILPDFGESSAIPDHEILTESYTHNTMDKVLSLFNNIYQKIKGNLPKTKESVDNGNIIDPEYKVVFLLGLPSNDNDSSIQNKILNESARYGDIIQEGFIDSYNNLTLKSIMMLKWITNNCNDSVRYILKTDDDMYINVPNLIDNLQNRSREFDKKTKGRSEKEYLLIGYLFCGETPVRNSSSRWYSPRYMYEGSVYPNYLSGTGYALSSHAASALYEAALRTNFLHLEDVFVTGLCASRSNPRIHPRMDPTFSYLDCRRPEFQGADGQARAVCGTHSRASAHHILPDAMRYLNEMLGKRHVLDTCERIRLTKVKFERLGPNSPARVQR